MSSVSTSCLILLNLSFLFCNIDQTCLQITYGVGEGLGKEYLERLRKFLAESKLSIKGSIFFFLKEVFLLLHCLLELWLSFLRSSLNCSFSYSFSFYDHIPVATFTRLSSRSINSKYLRLKPTSSPQTNCEIQCLFLLPGFPGIQVQTPLAVFDSSFSLLTHICQFQSWLILSETHFTSVSPFDSQCHRWAPTAHLSTSLAFSWTVSAAA